MKRRNDTICHRQDYQGNRRERNTGLACSMNCKSNEGMKMKDNHQNIAVLALGLYRPLVVNPYRWTEPVRIKALESPRHS